MSKKPSFSLKPPNLTGDASGAAELAQDAPLTPTPAAQPEKPPERPPEAPSAAKRPSQRGKPKATSKKAAQRASKGAEADEPTELELLAALFDETLNEGKLGPNTNIRFPTEMTRRIDLILGAVESDTSKVMRRALCYGLPLVERELAARGIEVPTKLPEKLPKL